MKKWLILSVITNIILLLFIGIYRIVTTAENEELVRNFQIDHYLMKTKLAEKMIKKDSSIIFFGDSQFEYANWNELLERDDILNRGIAGDVISGLIGRVEEICRHQPKKIFIEIGTNDLSMGLSVAEIMADYEKLIEEIKSRISTEIYINSVLPVQDLPGENYQNTEILNLNRKIKDFCEKQSLKYIDLTETFTDDNSGNLKTEYTSDGLHLNAKGYLEWKRILMPFL
jgi:lysophospholipase L1-like esterase